MLVCLFIDMDLPFASHFTAQNLRVRRANSLMQLPAELIPDSVLDKLMYSIR
jgi:hypothetical protein